MSDEPQGYTTGYPLPTVTIKLMGAEDDAEPRTFPVPWINGEHGLKGDFYSFRDDCSRAFTERLCCICGDPLNLVVAIAALSASDETSGGWGHPRCTNLAVNVCPHFAPKEEDPFYADSTKKPVDRETEIVAWLYNGPGVGCTAPDFSTDIIDEPALAMNRADLTMLARVDPWGKNETRVKAYQP